MEGKINNTKEINMFIDKMNLPFLVQYLVLFISTENIKKAKMFLSQKTETNEISSNIEYFEYCLN